MMMAKAVKKFVWATGRRKRAVARVRIYPSAGPIVLNTKEVTALDSNWSEPLKLADIENRKIEIKVSGGGISSQKGAIRLGIARSLLHINPDLRTTFRAHDLLTRDPREKERKKPGLKRARRAPQWQKR